MAKTKDSYDAVVQTEDELTAQVEETAGPASTSSTSNPTHVRYVGRATVKVLDEAALLLAGVETSLPEPLTWGPGNNKCIAAETLDASVVEYLRTQPDFRVE